ncbi:MAG: hypothetical protein AB7P76_03855 [Candidatus Melainabacteria bacterium]
MMSVRIDQIPQYEPGEQATRLSEDNTYQFADHLIEVLQANGIRKKGNFLFMPSILSLCNSLHCSIVEVHNALRSLRTQGYRYNVFGLDSPITFWYDKASQPKTRAARTPASARSAKSKQASA